MLRFTIRMISRISCEGSQAASKAAVSLLIGSAGGLVKYLPASLAVFVWLFSGMSAAQLVIVTPPQVVLSKGQKMQLRAYKHLSTGTAKDVTNSSTWTSVEPTIATVTRTGVVTMKATGSALIVATYNGQPGYGTVWN